MGEVAKMLHLKHGSKFAIFNLSDKRSELAQTKAQVTVGCKLCWCEIGHSVGMVVSFVVDCLIKLCLCGNGHTYTIL